MASEDTESPQPIVTETACKSATSDHEDRASAQRYWERQALAAERLNWIAFGSALSALLGLFGIYHSFKAAEKAANEAQRQADLAFAQLRPWLSVIATIDGDVMVGPDNAEVPIGFAISNVGHSPALAVDLFYEIRPYGFAARMPIATSEFCDAAKVSPSLGPGHWMPPDGKLYSKHEVMMVSTSLINKSTEADSKRRFWVVVVGCVTYRISGDQHMHETPFTYQLYQWLPENPKAMTSFRYQPGAIFNRETLRLQEFDDDKNQPD